MVAGKGRSVRPVRSPEDAMHSTPTTTHTPRWLCTMVILASLRRQ